ncbi:uncharacterized protein LOC108107794 [Drosophila eugracilis]|uniref:uncharacterized protein LOC108107794 n=1 Tax=Drosophila eugracilis TaxID=29029 RepID=UPI0007E623FF|nr:uncharacterized protein LOC108107794 [Drosophila eugracilis]XP_017070995.1 uncharacterized protein LOC108107794 [Drosophila eugracilis]XP_017070996.1 uncharacterized protein LOC108107794 [Drosophila eugracilis]XP_017070997.1 uncharacterized protein LOC108107794 [Drosophila eugracilis]XP_017070998.1 uncharacterized protein LOC108107794 [Drosophila eugracilis]
MYDKSKKSWSQRLKTLGSGDSVDKNASLAAVSGMQAMQQLQLHMQQQHQQLQQQHQQMQQQQQQQQQQPHLPHHGHHQMVSAYQLPPVSAAEFLPSALSRSMKYAEPWIYGTVRGIPARPSYGYHPHAAAIFAATEGVPGTTALAVVICSCAEYLNGTKRDVKKASVCKKCKGSRLPLATIGGTGGTVRLPAVSGSSNSRRPMAATMRVVSATKKSRPSILDPQKDPYDLMRRTRLLSPEPSSKDADGKSRSRTETGGNQQRGRTRTRAPPPPAPSQKSQGVMVSAVPDPTDCWLMEDNESLLQSSGLASRASSRRSILRCHVNPYDLISSENGKLQSNLRKPHDPFNVADAQLNDDDLERKRSTSKFYSGNVAAIAGQRISLGDKSGDSSDPGDSYERIIIVSGGETSSNGPRRPPRNKKADEPEEMPAATTAGTASTPAAVAAAIATVKPKAVTLLEVEQKVEDKGSTYTVLTVTPTSPGIKSILKRPSTLELPGVGITPLPLPPNDNSGLVTPAGKSQFYIPTPTGTAATPTPNSMTPMATSTPTPTAIGAAITPGSRKKVQFMVEDKIIATTATAATTDDSDASVAATKTNYEYYNRKRNAAAAATSTATSTAAATTTAAATATTAAATSTDQQEATLFAADVDDEHNFTTSAEPTPFIKPDSLHYEDVLPGPQIFDSNEQPAAGGSSSSKLLLPADGSPHVTVNPVSVLPTGASNGVGEAGGPGPGAAGGETPATASQPATQKTTAANRDYDDDDEHNDKDESHDNKPTNDLAERDQDQDKDKQQKKETEISRQEKEKDAVGKPAASQKRAAQTTQSRNPIRRAHSERHLSTAPLAATTSGHGHAFSGTVAGRNCHSIPTTPASGPQNVILNFKDTMALRIKSNRSDSRDLFQRRPTEPPPPPPKGAGKGLEPLPHEINKSPLSPQRTVVRVAPFKPQQQQVGGVVGDGFTQEVHRLKISHSEDDTDLGVELRRRPNTYLISPDEEDAAPKKTSILISGDDCYSTMNLSADAAQPLYQSSVVVNSHSATSVCINVSSAEEQEQELNQLNTLRSQQMGMGIAIIPIRGASEVNLQRSVSCISSTSSSSTSSSSSSSGRGRTLIRLDYERERKGSATSSTPINTPPVISSTPATPPPPDSPSGSNNPLVPHETELLKILRNPVEAVKLNLVPHVCGLRAPSRDSGKSKKIQEGELSTSPPKEPGFIAKLLQDPMLGQVAEGLETETVVELIENSLHRLQQTRRGIDMSGTKDHDDMNRLISASLQRIRLERQPATTGSSATKEEDRLSNRGSISSANSFASAHNYELFDFDGGAGGNESDCYQSCSSELTASGVLEDDSISTIKDPESELDTATRAKFYQLLVDATLAEIEHSTHMDQNLGTDSEHHYESIRHSGDPIYEEIHEVPPPLPLSAPPLNDAELDKKAARSIFEGASKYDILSYLVDAKERGLAREESFDYGNNPKIIEEEAADTLSDLDKRQAEERERERDSGQSSMSSLSPPPHNFICGGGGKSSGSDVERQDSGVGSETSKTSRSKYQATPTVLHLCEDCDGAVEMQVGDGGVLYAPLVCRKCGKKRVERKEIITEIVETEEKYGRDLQIILEEFCHPMLVAGLLTQEQLSAIFLNTEDLLENNQTLAERMRDALDMSLEQGDDDLLTVNIGRIFLDFTQMLHAFESYCVRQAGASLLLANLEKEKELLRIFLKVSQMENAVLRRMNLNSFLMVPVQRVTKYPLLLARLYKVTPSHLDGRDLLKQAQEKIELHLNHINQEAKDVPTKLWRRISSSSPNRRASCEIDMINIKLRKMAIDILEWNHDEVRFAMEGRLLYTQPTDSNWKKARTIKLTPVNALLVTNGKPSANYRAEKAMSEKLNFPKHTGIREASLLLVKEKCGRYTLIREPLYLDRCVVCSEADWDDYFEVQEISSKDTFIFKAEDGVRTKQWYTQLQYHAQGMGAWRKRRNALANIMINGMLARS